MHYKSLFAFQIYISYFGAIIRGKRGALEVRVSIFPTQTQIYDIPSARRFGDEKNRNLDRSA